MSDDTVLREMQRRLRKLKEQRARSGIDTRPQIETEIEDLEAEIEDLDGGAARAALPRPPQPDFAHPYPIQSGFAGRAAERKMLSVWLSDSPQPVLAVIGIGGMGKSALTWAWLQRDVLGLALPGAVADAPEVAAACRLPEEARPMGVLWWSFYETQAGFASFLDEAIGYASDHAINPRDLPSTYDKARTLLNLLQHKRLLLVLDGFERELRAYSGMGAAYQGDAVEKEPRGEHRACADPHAGRFLRDAATLPLQSRILITSRLFPRELDDLAGCGRQDLATIDPEDAVAFFRSQGIRGTRAEIQAACAPYGYHALALRLLAGLIKHDPSQPGEIHITAELESPKLVQREHHVLELAYEALPPPLRSLLGMLAAFRSPVAFETLQEIYDSSPEQKSGFVSAIRHLFQRSISQPDLKSALKELVERGLVFFDREHRRYDIHPVVRGYAYDRLGDKPVVHIRLYGYFLTITVPNTDDIHKLDDLTPLIELYHHTVHAGRYDTAFELYRDRLVNPLYYRLGVSQTCIELLGALFPDGEDQLPQLKDKDTQAWVLNNLANSYSLAGQPRRAVPLFERHNVLQKAISNTANYAIGLENLAYMAQILLGELAAAEHNLRHSIDLMRQIGNKFDEAVGHVELGLLLVYQNNTDQAVEELSEAQAVFDSQGVADTNYVSIVRAYKALLRLLQGDGNTSSIAARQALELALVDNRSVYGGERDIIRAKWLLGVALVALAASNDDNSAIIEAESHLTEALIRCRRINLVDIEPDILLAWAKWHRLQGNAAQARADAAEALQIADRCEFRLKQADIHNFLARLALDAGDRATARREAEIARERAWCDGPPHCYKPALDEAERLLGEIG